MERILFPASNGSLLRLTVDIVEVEVQASQGNDPGDNSNRQGLPAKYFVNSVNWLISCTNIAECMCILIVNCFMCWHSFVELGMLPQGFFFLQLLLPCLPNISGVCVLGDCRLVGSEPSLWSSTNCISQWGNNRSKIGGSMFLLCCSAYMYDII